MKKLSDSQIIILVMAFIAILLCISGSDSPEAW
jgi:hypothetical protein